MAATEWEISNTFKWLKTAKHVLVNVEWLEACISWLKSRNTAHKNLNMRLQDDVYEQWLMSDLKESGSSCLPDEISTRPTTNIPGIVALQMNSIVNIGASAYSQQKKLKNEVTSTDENETQTWQPKPCRMLKLELTDGEKTIEGMEYQPMKKLSTDLIPGTKILIKADTLCRCGMLFLTDENIEILGGQVEQLNEQNSQLNILNKLVMNAKERNGRFLDNTGTRQSHSRSSNNHRSFPTQHLEWTTQHNNEDFQALLNEDDDFLAELDVDVNPVELNGHQAELDDDINHLLDSDDDMLDGIPENMLDGIPENMLDGIPENMLDDKENYSFIANIN